MLEVQMVKLKNKIETQSQLSSEQKRELMSLVNELSIELDKVESHQAHVIAEKAQGAVESPSPDSAEHFQDSIREFEITHPNLTRIVQSICAQFGV